jgi:Ca2+-binding RTX toxin-like protein
MSVITGDATDNILIGTIGADQISGLDGNDILTGDAGDDLLDGGAGADSLDGGADTDTVTYAGSAAGVMVNLATGTGSGGDAAGDTYVAIENVIGSGFSDTITGGSAINATLDGGAGDDTIAVSAASTTVIGGSGTDTISYALAGSGVTVNLATGTGSNGASYSGVESVIGSGFNDTITGSTTIGGTLDGDNGDDTLVVRAGSTMVIGGAGTDTVSYASSGAGVAVNLTTNTGGSGDTYSDIENVIGSAFGDTIVGGSVAGTLNGGGGNDTITATVAGTTVIGGSGSDTVTFAQAKANYGIAINASGAVVVSGGEFGGAVTLSGVETLQFLDGNQAISIGTNAGETLTGTGGNDIMNGLGGSDTINAGDGNDIVSGSIGFDTVNGGNGTDILDYSTFTPPGPYNGLYFAAHVNELYYFNSSALNVWTLAGNFQNFEHVIGSAGNDWMYDSAADEIFEGGAGADIFSGLTGGNDTLSYEHSAAGVSVNLATGAASGGDAQGDFFLGYYTEPTQGSNYYAAGVDNLWGSAFADTLSGDGGANILKGNAGADTLAGADGNDTLDGGDGNDTISGGNGTDRAVYRMAIGNYSFSYSGGTITVTANSSDEGIDTLTDVETLLFANQLYDFSSWTGGALPTPGIPLPTAGDDILTGTAGSDTINAGDGNDIVNGSLGPDALDGGSGVDTLSYSAFTPPGPYDALYFAAHVNELYYYDSSTLNVWTLAGSFQNFEHVIAGAGDDWMIDSAGDEIFEGGAGADIFAAINGGSDTLSYEHSSASVSVNLATGAASGGDAQGDFFLGYYTEPTQGGNYYAAGVDNIWGSAHADTLTGDGGANSLKGNAGGDTLTGAGGNDTLIGGNGSDSYVIARGDGVDSIVQSDIGDAAGTTDTLTFTSGVAYDQLWFRHVGNDLQVDVIGETASSTVLKDWYIDSSRRVDGITTVDGSHSLSAANVQALVDAMASYSPPGTGQFTLDTQTANDLAPVFATVWA